MTRKHWLCVIPAAVAAVVLVAMATSGRLDLLPGALAPGAMFVFWRLDYDKRFRGE